MGQLVQFRALSWKNTLLNKHVMMCVIIFTLILLLLIILIAAELIMLHVSKKERNATIITTIAQNIFPIDIYYMHKDDFVENVMKCVEKGYSANASAVRSDREMKDRVNGSALAFGVVFASTSAPHVTYELRSVLQFPTDAMWVTDLKHVPDHNSKLNPHVVDESPAGVFVYDFFVFMQVAIDHCVIQELVGRPVPYQVVLKRLPPPSLYYTYLATFQLLAVLPFLLMLTTFAPFIMGTYLIAREKREGVKMLYHLMGARNMTHWLSWLLCSFVTAVVFSGVIAAIAFIPFQCGWLMLFSFFFLFMISQFAMCFLICVLINNVFLSIITVVLVLQICLQVSGNLATDSTLHYAANVVPSFFFPALAALLGLQDIQNSATGGGCRHLGALFGEGDKEGLCWDVAALLMLCAWVFYFFLTLYLDPIFPGKYGTPARFDWPLRRGERTVDPATQMEDSRISMVEQENVERPTEEEKPVIRLVGLTKTFKKGTTVVHALKDVSLEIYENHVTVVIGHNGAGKSTLLNLISGFAAPTAGRVYVTDKKIVLGTSSARQVSLCPQENMFIPFLTVREHLVFAAKMRRMRGGAKEEDMVDDVTEKLGLKEHWPKRPSELSGGYKRRLCLALAMMGETKLVYLDEPTSGLDPEARRDVWNAILNVRTGTTIVITTQSMEEADVLGEKIIIISQGSLLCYGSPSYLRRLYGSGYTLTVQCEGGNYKRITDAVKRSVPTADTKMETESVVTYNLPSTENNKFEAMFTYLETHKVELRIISLDLSVSSIEDVYIKANKYEEQDVSYILENYAMNRSAKVSRKALTMQQMRVLFWKETLHTTKMWCLFAVKVLLILIFLLLGIFFLRGKDENLRHPLSMRMINYPQTVVRYYIAPNVPQGTEEALEAAVVMDDCSVKAMDSEEAILKAEEEDDKAGRSAQFEHVVAMAVPKPGVFNAYFSVWGIHTAPAAAALASNIQLKQIQKEYSITTINNPYPAEMNISGRGKVGYWLLSNLGWCLYFVAFTWLHIEERRTGVKQLQLMAGTSPEMYWVVRFLWHLSVHAIVCALCLAFVLFVDVLYLHLFYEKEIGFLCLLWFLGGFCGIPFMYMISFFAADVTTCYITVILLFFICKVIVLLQGLLSQKFQINMDIIVDVLLPLPMMALQRLVIIFFDTLVLNKQCSTKKAQDSKMCETDPSHICCRCEADQCDIVDTYYTDDARYGLLALTMGAILWMLLTMLLEYGVADVLRHCCVMCLSRHMRQKDEDTSYVEDSDVAREVVICDTGFSLWRERERYAGHTVLSSMRWRAALVARRLEKRYTPRRRAVKGVSIWVRSGECFGLLGHNGAGKSSTFGMLTGSHRLSAGDAITGRRLLSSNSLLFAQRIGYCPQYDALLPTFTGRQMARLLARLRGETPDKERNQSDVWLQLLGIEGLDRECRTYSGGNKRKLNAALALIGEPPVLFLDEPTSGVDVWSRRKLWRAMKEIRRMGQSVVLTSHSMDECEALCDRLAIMSGGRLHCLGSVAHLKAKFWRGFTLHVRLAASGYAQKIQANIRRAFPACSLVDHHGVMMVFRLEDTSLHWSQLFGTMQKMQQENAETIEDYAISDTSLEEIFLSIRH